MVNKILIIDDDQSILIALKALLELEGFEVVTAENGEIGFDLFEVFEPNLILVDVMMPVMDGLEMVSKVRGTALSEQTKIIYLSAKGMEMDRTAGYASGADDYIVKPFSNVDLLELIHLYLE